MNTPENTTENDLDQNKADKPDQATSNDNAELDKITAAEQAAEPAFTLNYESRKGENEDDDSSGTNKSNLKG